MQPYTQCATSVFEVYQNRKKTMVAPRGHEHYNKNGEGGRPVKYTQEFIENEAIAFEEWMQKPGSIYFKRFAFERGYSVARLSEFAQTNQRFSDVYARAHEWQEIRLAEGGLTNEFNSGFCKFVMGNVCGWSERKETKISSEDDSIANLMKLISNTSGDLVVAK